MAAHSLIVPLQSIELSPGSHLLIPKISWEQYESLLEEWGSDRVIPRINYSNGILELMAPLPAHERPHRIIGYIVTTLLDAQGQDWEDFGSTTFKKFQQAGLEPDTCFYIRNAQRIRSRQRIDLENDPPPDLAIESDLTSTTTLDAYLTIQVPEVWIYANCQLKIKLLTSEGYQEASESQIFPDLDIQKMIPRLIEQAFVEGTRAMLRSLRQRLQSNE
ncbi:Uma2 family endonuclease [Oscillatoria sp. FACHB-1406]|uniref:Uma2 family endonuclease n=1 Tax=Oscillatoria sp. FACHB-1406 TaxID=2692846 RepID=UPI001688DB71|nr:Uma2 family endonuclease [Oscillatoria sp. FACHB-1406]MBD2578114.1 Uma2 family endonuclease [Oscillatoria sp. FACHB-1406]